MDLLYSNVFPVNGDCDFTSDPGKEVQLRSVLCLQLHVGSLVLAPYHVPFSVSAIG